MDPFFVAILAMLLVMANRLYSKYLLDRLDSYALALIPNIIGIILALPFAWTYLPILATFSQWQIGLLALSIPLWLYNAWIGNISVAQNEFSFKEIIRQTRVLWVVAIGLLLLDEKLTQGDILGIVFIVFSVFLISYRSYSFREHVSSKPILLAWSISLVSAAIVIIEKLIVDTMPVALYAFLSYLMTSIALLPFFTQKRRAAAYSLITNHYGKTFLCALIMATAYFAVLSAYQRLPISTAYPIIQSATGIGVFVGALFFEKGDSLARKTVAALIAVAGVILIQFS